MNPRPERLNGENVSKKKIFAKVGLVTPQQIKALSFGCAAVVHNFNSGIQQAKAGGK